MRPQRPRALVPRCGRLQVDGAACEGGALAERFAVWRPFAHGSVADGEDGIGVAACQNFENGGQFVELGASRERLMVVESWTD